jgi:hypothetical protein
MNWKTFAASLSGTCLVSVIATTWALAPKSTEQLLAELQTSFDSDRADGAWSKQALVEKLTHVLPEGVALDSVECRTKMCRIQTTSLDDRRFRDFFSAALASPASRVLTGNTANIRLGSPSGTSVVIVSYVSRNGPLPFIS